MHHSKIGWIASGFSRRPRGMVFSHHNPVIDFVQPDTLGYGFDDGPNCSHNVFYNFLSQNNQKASTSFRLSTLL